MDWLKPRRQFDPTAKLLASVDDVTLNAGSGGDTISADDLGTVKVQRVKVQYGVDGSATDVSDSNPLPIDDAGGSLTVDGTVTLGANSGVDIGDTDVTSVIPGTGATNLGKAVDSAGGATDTGVAPLALRDDALTTLTPIDGDYTNLRVDSTGALWVNVSNAEGTATDDAAFTPGTGTGVPIFAAFDDTTPDSVDEGDAGIVRMSANRNLYSTIRDAAGNERGVNVNASNQLETSANQSGTWNITNVSGTVSLPTGAATAANQSSANALLTTIDADTGGILTAVQTIDNSVFADDAAFTLASSSVNMAGAIRDDALSTLTAVEGDAVPLRVSSTGALHVTGGGGGTQYSIDDAGPTVVTMAGAIRDDALTTLTEIDGDASTLRVGSTGALWTTVSGTVTVDGSGVTQPVSAASLPLPSGASTAANQSTAITALQLIDNPIVAHDAAISGSTGVNVAGARATNSIEGLTQVAAADATQVTADLNGCLVTRPHTTLEEIISERVSDTSGTSTNFTNFAAGGAGVHNYVTTISIYNSSATDGYVDFRDGSAGSVIFTAAAPATGGSVINFPVPLKGAANTALAYDVSGALSTVYISVIGFQAQG